MPPVAVASPQPEGRAQEVNTNRLIVEITDELLGFMNEWDYYELHADLLDDDELFESVQEGLMSDTVGVIAYLQSFEGSPAEAQANRIIEEIKQISNL